MCSKSANCLTLSKNIDIVRQLVRSQLQFTLWYYCAAVLSYKSPFVAPFGKKSEATAKKCEFAVANSDHVTALKAYQAYSKAAQQGRGAAFRFCSDNFMSSKTIEVRFSLKYAHTQGM